LRARGVTGSLRIGRFAAAGAGRIRVLA
jgi:hypothetical protein